jgi:alkanesulfonate monooxygenase SsuD/methylene tetrahydromethanopterin reductase-like flavin-dependent oxidoreductase (luciferase family)
MRTVATMADGWNCPGASLGLLDDRLAFLAKACERADRSIDDLRLSCQIVCAVDDEKAANHPAMAMFNPDLGFVGDAERSAARARELMSKGITDFNCIVAPGPRGRAALERMIDEVRPKVTG